MSDELAAEPGTDLPLDVSDGTRLGLPVDAGGDSPAGPALGEPAIPGPDAAAREQVDAGDAQETAALPSIGATLPMWLPATTQLPVVPAPVEAAAGSHVVPELPAPSNPRHRRQPWALLVASILLALTLGLATYLLLTTRAYEHRSAEWETAARTAGSQLTQARADLEATTSDLAATRDQLATAQARIIQLADEKAQLGDDRALQRQLADYQQRISAAAGNVATALNSCIDGQYKLIGYLDNPTAYNQTDLARFRADVQTVCGAARDANTALQRELKK